MALALDYTRKQSEKMRSAHRPPLPGFEQAHIFSLKGGHTGSPIIYFIPAIGRGKERSKALNVLVNFCPFCGYEHREMKGEAKEG